ncbi:E3 ubiquitin-protein ligase KEG-like [Olea europaea var. sylvestris]|uniref:E3 ubiquitin-protein ligase KEG n=1 Tax=Olea europaea subsp. europaea TaxID=158383 RepID=A0A8S0UIV7_OLEEU|nr:E3 ubiquitin-protein ligase KEG-like [Olea europaea var. sylvestris]XP_022870669.1 E3 ubiquitin-protein ligase KEG-like [Olea europaea var. sylvestris]CAA3019923.1 E3 ubiquitin-protein ligase KEG [Olea europaea subsp. europaea]
MAGQVVANQSMSISDFELVERDSGDSGGSAVVSSNHIHPWIDPATIELKHRIGRGPFGDVWLATYHRATEDYEEYHEVAVKMLHSIKEDNVKDVLVKLEDLHSKCRGLENVFWLHGLSVISEKICIVMKFYEGSVGDKMACLKGGKLSLNDVLRYGADLAEGVMDLHSKEILILNLKPFNFLLNEHDRAILGDIGIPNVFLGISLPSTDVIQRLGTPNYMAPEQWQPDIIGPLSFETDSWGFGCSIVEMLTGIQPWSGKSIDEIHKLVVKKQEKPHIPSGLPPAVENVIIGCFEYDFMSRPRMADILHAFKSSQNAVNQDGSWTGLGSRTIIEKLGGSNYTEWFLAKDHLQVGDMVRSRKSPNSCKLENVDVLEGSVVGLECDTERDGLVLVRMHGLNDPIRVHASTLERVTFGMAAGDWVLLKKEDKKHSPVGILHSIDRDGNIAVGFVGLETLWKGNYSEIQIAKPYRVGKFVRLRSNVFSPRFDWPWKRSGEWAAGRICQILPNGCLVVEFPGRLILGDENKSFLADPAEVELVSFDTCPGLVKKYQHLEDFHWAVKPLLIALGLFTAMKLGLRVGKKLGRLKLKKGRNHNILKAS